MKHNYFAWNIMLVTITVLSTLYMISYYTFTQVENAVQKSISVLENSNAFVQEREEDMQGVPEITVAHTEK